MAGKGSYGRFSVAASLTPTRWPLTLLMQSLLAGFAEDLVVFGALHALDGLLALGIAADLYFWSRRRES
jgi:hypothetical protein